MQFTCDGRVYEQVIPAISYNLFSLVATQTKEDNGYWTQTVCCDYYASSTTLTRSSEFRSYVGNGGTYWQANAGLVRIKRILGLPRI